MDGLRLRLLGLRALYFCLAGLLSRFVVLHYGLAFLLAFAGLKRVLSETPRRTSAGRAVSGMQAVWLAARAERPEMLVVEQGLFHPARLSPDGDLLTPADDIEHPDVIDDAVDEVIEIVLRRGGWVALAEDGTLAGHDRIALTVLDR